MELVDALAVGGEVHIQVPAEILRADGGDADQQLEALVRDHAGILALVEITCRVGDVEAHDVLRGLLVVIRSVDAYAAVEHAQVHTDLVGRLVLRLEVGIGEGRSGLIGQQTAVGNLVGAHELQEVGVRRVVEEVELIGGRVAADIGVAQAQLTEIEDVVLRDQLREDEAEAHRRIEVRTVRLGHGRRPVVTPRDAQEEHVAPAQVGFSVETYQATLALVVGRRYRFGVRVGVDAFDQQFAGVDGQVAGLGLVDVVAAHDFETPVVVASEQRLVGDDQVVVDRTVVNVVGVETSRRAYRTLGRDLAAVFTEEVRTEVVGDRQSFDRGVGHDRRAVNAVYGVREEVLHHVPVEK